MQVKMTPRRSFPRRPTPPGSMLAMLKQRFEETRVEPPRQCESIPYNKGRFAIIGDVQPTSRVEFWRKSNARERVQLIQQIAMELPDFLAIVGDLVSVVPQQRTGPRSIHWLHPCTTHVCLSSRSWVTMTMGLCGTRL